MGKTENIAVKNLLRRSLKKYCEAEVEAVVQPLATQIIQLVKPELLILFGSAVTGSFDRESDLDFILVLEDDQKAKEALKHLGPLRAQSDHCLDLICVSRERFANRDLLSGVLQVAAKEGKILYRG